MVWSAPKIDVGALTLLSAFWICFKPNPGPVKPIEGVAVVLICGENILDELKARDVVVGASPDLVDEPENPPNTLLVGSDAPKKGLALFT